MRFIVLLAALTFCCGKLDAQEAAGGFVYGENHAYFLAAPKGWVMDVGDASKEQVGAVFHPKGIHWPASGVIIYTDFYRRTKAVQTPSEAMRADVEQFKKDGSEIQPIEKPSIKGGVKQANALVYQFGPDKRGQYDARAYSVHGDYIDYFVLTARDQTIFKKSLPAFEELIKSYVPRLKIIQEKPPLEKK